MNPNIIQAIEQDNLDLFELLYSPYVKFDENITKEEQELLISKFIKWTINGLDIFLITYKIYIAIKTSVNISNISINKSNANIKELRKIFDTCLIHNSIKIFDYVLHIIIPEYIKLFNIDYNDYLYEGPSKKEYVYFYYNSIIENRCNTRTKLILRKVFNKIMFSYIHHTVVQKDILFKVINLIDDDSPLLRSDFVQAIRTIFSIKNLPKTLLEVKTLINKN